MGPKNKRMSETFVYCPFLISYWVFEVFLDPRLEMFDRAPSQSQSALMDHIVETLPKSLAGINWQRARQFRDRPIQLPTALRSTLPTCGLLANP